MARGTEDRECKDWEQHCIKPGNHGQASNPCVAEYLGDIHRRKGHASDYIAQRSFQIERP
jgi:hypothetical protein